MKRTKEKRMVAREEILLQLHFSRRMNLKISTNLLESNQWYLNRWPLLLTYTTPFLIKLTLLNIKCKKVELHILTQLKRSQKRGVHVFTNQIWLWFMGIPESIQAFKILPSWNLGKASWSRLMIGDPLKAIKSCPVPIVSVYCPDIRSQPARFLW